MVVDPADDFVLQQILILGVSKFARNQFMTKTTPGLRTTIATENLVISDHELGVLG